MKTELENYLEFIDTIGGFNKNETFLLEITPKDDTKKEVAFYTIIHPNTIFEDRYCHFRFVSDKIGRNALEDFERGLVNLAAKGYKINYHNKTKDGQI